MVKKNSGFTFVETMVVVSIFSFISAAMYMVLATARNSWLSGEALVVEQENIRIGLENVVNQMRLAGFATIDADARGVIFSVPVDTDADGFVNLATGTILPVYGADGHINWAIKYQIDTATNTLVRILLDGDTEVARRVVARNINPDNTLSFFQSETGGTGVANEAVIISLTTQVNEIQGRTISPPLVTTLITRVNLRNAS